MTMLRRGFTFSARASDEGKREADIIASTAEIDSYGERIDQAGWDLTRYAKNPVVLFGHNSYGLPIGHAPNARVEGGALRATVRFVDAQANELAEKVYQGIVQKSIRGVSVGFRSKATRIEEIEGRSVPVHTAVELLEISIVTLPANPGAVITDARAFKHQEHHVMTTQKQWFQMTGDEKRELWLADEEKARALMDAEPTWKGKTWDQLSTDEKVALYREDRATFLAMEGG